MDPGMDRQGGDENAIQSEGLRFVFTAQRDNFPNNPCPYYDDGNPDMYSEDNMKKRNDLKKDPIVKEAIDDFMTEFQRNNQLQCTKEEYFKVFMKVGMILRPGIEADDLQRIVKEDFELDSMDQFQPPEQKGEDQDNLKEAEKAQIEFEQNP